MLRDWVFLSWFLSKKEKMKELPLKRNKTIAVVISLDIYNASFLSFLFTAQSKSRQSGLCFHRNKRGPWIRCALVT